MQRNPGAEYAPLRKEQHNRRWDYQRAGNELIEAGNYIFVV